jgi:hypothetical protein
VQISLGDIHSISEHAADLDGYAASGLPAKVMGRGIDEDRLFFAAALAAGEALGATVKGAGGGGG